MSNIFNQPILFLILTKNIQHRGEIYNKGTRNFYVTKFMISKIIEILKEFFFGRVDKILYVLENYGNYTYQLFLGIFFMTKLLRKITQK